MFWKALGQWSPNCVSRKLSESSFPNYQHFLFQTVIIFLPRENVRVSRNLRFWFSAGVANPRPKKKFLRPKLYSRTSYFSIFWVYFFRLLLLCSPKSLYFYQFAAQRPIWSILV
jgi:hypothetical protein